VKIGAHSRLEEIVQACDYSVFRLGPGRNA
jgi:hypothetical protein